MKNYRKEANSGLQQTWMCYLMPMSSTGMKREWIESLTSMMSAHLTTQTMKKVMRVARGLLGRSNHKTAWKSGQSLWQHHNMIWSLMSLEYSIYSALLWEQLAHRIGFSYWTGYIFKLQSIYVFFLNWFMDVREKIALVLLVQCSFILRKSCLCVFFVIIICFY